MISAMILRANWLAVVPTVSSEQTPANGRLTVSSNDCKTALPEKYPLSTLRRLNVMKRHLPTAYRKVPTGTASNQRDSVDDLGAGNFGPDSSKYSETAAGVRCLLLRSSR